MRVADACAGNGGKTLHIATLMQNKGKIVAMDVVQNKLDELRARCTRNGIDLAETKLINSPEVIAKMAGTFDRVLLDVPCTGTGVLRRNPDIRWRLYPEDVKEMVVKQQEILNAYASLVKQNGKLVYATCSIFPCEGEEQVKRFLDSNADSWKLEEELRINPVSDDGDGFYLARMKKI
jgi:16S rRNA (cytosine967-C5)-methyltransferase